MGLEEHILSWRRHFKLTQEELARRSGIPRPNLSDIERGTSDPKLSTLRRLAAGLNITTGELIDNWPPFPKLDRFELDEMAKGPIKKKIMPQRLRALGLTKARSTPEGEWALRVLRADLGEVQFKALLARIDRYLIKELSRRKLI